MKKAKTNAGLPGWSLLRHGGLLIDHVRLQSLDLYVPDPLEEYTERQLRQHANSVLDGSADIPQFISFVLERVCGLNASTGSWSRGTNITSSWGRRLLTGETVKPNHLWLSRHDAQLPVFVDDGKRLGIGRSRRIISQVLGWLRTGNDHLALITNGRQWRLLFAGLDYDAWCEWDLDLWFEEGGLSPQVTALRTLLGASLWTPETEEAAPPLLQVIRDSRKGQAELSEILGERVREAVEVLIQGHGEALCQQCASVDTADIYRAACRVSMRLVVILFAEARDLLPRDNALYHESYGLNGLFEQLELAQTRGVLAATYGAWPRILALFNLILEGSHHPDLPVFAYGGDLFTPGVPDSENGLSKAMSVFEHACFESEALPDRDVHEMLQLLTRTTVRIRQGRGSAYVQVPVDFSDLSSEYIGILYEGLLDYELKIALPEDPVVFLSVGDQPALPLSRLESMDDQAIKALFEDLKKTSDDDSADEDASEHLKAEEEKRADGAEVSQELDTTSEHYSAGSDMRNQSRRRAETWAQRVAQTSGLVRKPHGRVTPERRLAFEDQLADKARQLVARVVLPDEWYLVRWGGTRKGSGSFYTRPGLAIPTVQRTLRPLAYVPPANADGTPDRNAPPARWQPKLPEQILELKVCDPACGSGTFPLAALRFLTDALYISLQHHGRIEPDGERALVRLLGIHNKRLEESGRQNLGDELIPCPPDDSAFEPRLKALLRRYVVERCIYAVDLDPLAVELCRLSLWIETMDRTLPFGFVDHKIKCGNALIGAWIDEFCHYPVMAWKNREGGDKNHSNGVHFQKNERTKAIKAFVKESITPDLKLFLQGSDLFQENRLEKTIATHDQALDVLAKMHALPVQDTGERSRLYQQLQGSAAWRSLKNAMDLWCACWFWSPGDINCAPLPSTFADPDVGTRAVAERIAAQMRFFHWELEFPDVYREEGSGFNAILGNPPWDITKPNSKEFFSNIDPLYRSYGKQEALRSQSGYFESIEIEQNWLEYNARFRSQSNYMNYSASPFGAISENTKSQARFAIVRGRENQTLHERWNRARKRASGFADPAHPYRHQGSADLNLYKLFLDAAHTLLKPGGRLGFVVPSGLYSDHGTGALRNLLLEHCQWEWLFGIENRDKIFPIDGRSKFNPIIVEKGGATESIRTAFMRRTLEDWERAEDFATDYSRHQIERFSPKSHAILEIQSPRDLEILEKIYTGSVLLGDDGPDGWGIRYAREFDMTNDSGLFPPRPLWEDKGYRPDEYSRWLLGDWRPIKELWETLGIDPALAEPSETELDDWLFDTSAGPERRDAEARFVYGHLLKPGDVARTEWTLRCAQPPYDRLPVPRARLPVGVILSREGDAWIREERVEDVALPFYEGRMIGQFDFSQKGWVSGKGRSADWREIPWQKKQIEPQYLMSREDYVSGSATKRGLKLAVMDITSSTNSRTMVVSPVADLPCGHSVSVLTCPDDHYAQVCAILNSFVYDFTLRAGFSGLHASWFILEQSPLPRKYINQLWSLILRLSANLCTQVPFISGWIPMLSTSKYLFRRALTSYDRLRLAVLLDVLSAKAFDLGIHELHHILHQCDIPRQRLADAHREGTLNVKGFWRIDKNKDPELRHTVLTLIAFHDLQEKIQAAGGDRDKGIEAFLTQNNGEGWMLPETLRLADYGLGHDERAKHPQPVASRLGPRFYDWQLVQSNDESWRECHLHARNLLGANGYAQLIVEIFEHRIADGEDYLDFFADKFTVELLGNTGYVTVLLEIRSRNVMDEETYWPMVTHLHENNHLDEEGYGQLLDRLYTRNLLDDIGYRSRCGRNPPVLEDDTLLRVAESGANYQTGTPPNFRQKDLFE